jgi:hypothetical protein
MTDVAIRAGGLPKQYTIDAAPVRHDTLRDQLAHEFKRPFRPTYLNGAILGMRREEIDRQFDEIVASADHVFNLFSPVRGGIADWVQRAGSLKVVAGDFFGTGQLRTHDHGLLVRRSWMVTASDRVSAD